METTINKHNTISNLNDFSFKQLFVVDTDSYTGNFQREAIESMVGNYDNDYFGVNLDEEPFKGVTNDFAIGITCQLFYSTFNQNILPKCGNILDSPSNPDEYNSFCIMFSKVLTQEEITFLKQKAKAFCDKNDIKIKSFRLITANFTEQQL